MTDTRIDSPFTAMLTEATCGAACWHAREDVCRCSCGGANHGVLLKDGAEQPARTRKVRHYRYELVAVVDPLTESVSDVFRAIYEDVVGEPKPNYVDTAINPGRYRKQPVVAIEKATKAQGKWAEVANVNDWDPTDKWADMAKDRPRLIWKQSR